MISGHIATTLIAKRYLPEAPWWLLIAASYSMDFLMFVFVALGIERMEADPHAEGYGMEHTAIDMTYSHDLLPALGWTVLLGVAVWVGYRDRNLALVCVLLFVGHWLCDLLSGFGHFVFGPHSTPLGADLYHTNLLAAVVIESVFGVLCVLIATVKTDKPLTQRALLLVGFGLAPFSYLLL